MARLIVKWVAIAFLLLAAWLYNESRCDKDRVDAATREVPICLPVDLSVPETYRGTYRKSFARNHSDFLRLEAAPPFASEEDLREAVDGLSAVLVVNDGVSGPRERGHQRQ